MWNLSEESESAYRNDADGANKADNKIKNKSQLIAKSSLPPKNTNKRNTNLNTNEQSKLKNAATEPTSRTSYNPTQKRSPGALRKLLQNKSVSKLNIQILPVQSDPAYVCTEPDLMLPH